MGAEDIVQLVHSLQDMNHTGYHQEYFFDDLRILPHNTVWKNAFHLFSMNVVPLIKEPFNHVNLKLILNSWGIFDIIRLY